MKRLFPFLLTLSFLLLCACGTQPAVSSAEASPVASVSTSAVASPLDLADQLLEANVFSEPLEPLDPELALLIYQLDATLIPTELRAYRSSGATCEEVAVFVFANESDTAAALTGLKAYLATQLEICRSYRPAQVPKLEHAVLVQQGNTLCLVVANDWTAAAEIVK